MEPITYIIKVNLAILLFYGCFRLFFQRDTFFQLKRIALLSTLAFSLIYPLSYLHIEWAKNAQSTAVFMEGINTINLSEVVVSSQKTLSGSDQLFHIFTSGYTVVCIALLIRIIVRIFNIALIIYKGEKKVIAGINIHVMKGIQAPFSFFRWIVLDPNMHDESELQEIILHEKTHATQYHSLDIIFYELVFAFCWFNPVFWLMKKDVRINLEFLADRSVISSGCCSEHYQFHLLRLSYHKAIAQLSNNFNVSPLKKRIHMMNKRKTPWISRAKYLFFLPMVGMLLIANSCTQKAEKPDDKLSEPVLTASSDSVFQHVENMPEFPGGSEKLFEYICNSVKYPESAFENSIQGSVEVRFIVDKEGNIIEPEVVKSLNPACDKEAIRVISEMPKWTPGKQNGEAVRVYYTIPISYRISN